jgi:uncharacterized protein DUF6532
MPVAPGARNISLKAQPKYMKQVLKSAINHVPRTVLFKTAFPPLDSEDSRENYREILIKCAKSIENEELLDRFKHDDSLVLASARVVRTFQFFYAVILNHCVFIMKLNARVSSIRTQAKGVTDKKVEGFFQLIPGEETMERVKLLIGEMNYIYPLTSVSQLISITQNIFN